ncbi:MAG: RnfABCDGE type electron transport complex subunit G [Lachnospiraceae bacterium]|nr:RnfABCDGE type electron transport complex subunit G [Lachnospiraceae bacterium]
MKSGDVKGIIKDTLIIFAITLVAGGILGFVYELTKEPIALQQEQAKSKACAEVFMEPDENGELTEDVKLTFSEIPVDEKASADLTASGYTDAYIDGVYEAYEENGALYGYVLSVVDTKGYGGNINLYMGVSLDGTVQGISILSISETPGLGMRAEEVLVPQFFNRKADSFTVTKGEPNDSEISAITSATITSNAVTGGVNTGLRYFNLITEGGAN